MSQSRLEKVGTVYSRMSALLRSGARRKEFTPVWMQVYEAFPPRLEPRWDRPGSAEPLPTILYKEDRARAQFHRQFGHRVEVVDLLDEADKTLAQTFVDRFRKLEGGDKEGRSFEQLFRQTVEDMEAEGVQLKNRNAEAASARFPRLPPRRTAHPAGSTGGETVDASRPAGADMSSISFKELFSMGKEQGQSQQEDNKDTKS